MNAPSLRRVINATGIVLHAELALALPRSETITGYSNLEFSLQTGKHIGSQSHYQELLAEVLSSPGVAVNNETGALYLVLNEIAAGGEIIISRSELTDIGDERAFRAIAAHAGVTLREVGSVSTTTLHDYRKAIGEKTRLILRVHPSNLTRGFDSRPKLREIASLGAKSKIPVYEALGSGCLADLRDYGVQEPLVAESLDAGADLISFSTDQFFGGPQAGIIAGREDLVRRIQQNPMYPAFRCDMPMVGALETILRLYQARQYDDIPILWMIRRNSNEIKARAIDMAEGLDGEVIPGKSIAGGDAIPTWLIALNSAPEWDEHLRKNDPPVIARIDGDRLLIDLRTVFVEDEEQLRRALQARAI